MSECPAATTHAGLGAARSTLENLAAYYRDIEQGEVDEEKLVELWQKTSGLHTVEEWVTHVDRHPSGWGALLMIHGIPEVTGRLRTKVQNYAIYSALFLSCMISASLSSTSAKFDSCNVGENSLLTPHGFMPCEILKRIFLYSIVGSLTCHIVTILLAMSFVNALNEAARDADVFRMFSKGKGYLATEKCQHVFRAGVLLSLIAIMVRLFDTLGVEIVAVAAAFLCWGWRVYAGTTSALFSNGSIMHYWREGKGGNNGKDDPYDLSIPLERFKQRAQVGRRMAADFAMLAAPAGQWAMPAAPATPVPCPAAGGKRREAAQPLLACAAPPAAQAASLGGAPAEADDAAISPQCFLAPALPGGDGDCA